LKVWSTAFEAADPKSIPPEGGTPKQMLDKLAQIETRYEELTNELSSPELLSDPSAYGKAAKQHRSLGEIVDKYRSYKSLTEQLTGARELAANSEDADMRELAQIEIESLA